MYKDKEKQKESNRIASQRQRDRAKGMTQEGMTGQGMTQYPALLYALADPIKRAKLRRICEELKTHNQLSNVYYGYGDTSVPFDVVNGYLAVLT